MWIVTSGWGGVPGLAEIIVEGSQSQECRFVLGSIVVNFAHSSPHVFILW